MNENEKKTDQTLDVIEGPVSDAANTENPAELEVESDSTTEPSEMATNEDVAVEVPEPVSTVEEPTPEQPVSDAANSEVAPTETNTQRKRYFTIAAVVVVLAIFLTIFYSMEKQGRLSTGVFDGIERFMAKNETVATVNGEKISAQDLRISIQQIAEGARLQGIDPEDPQVQADIRTQAIEVLVNTELLLQDAVDRNIEVSEAEVQGRYDQLVTEVGGIEVLEERMAQFDIDDDTLFRDINHELTIQKLLDELFAEQPAEVTAAEISSFYESIGGEAAGFPPLSEMEAQIEAQLVGSKEQEIVSTYVELLRTNAVIEVKGR